MVDRARKIRLTHLERTLRRRNIAWGLFLSLLLAGIVAFQNQRDPEQYNDVLLWSVMGFVALATLLVLVAVVVGWALAAQVLPSAEITLRPRLAALGPLEVTVTASADVEALDAEAGTIPLTVISPVTAAAATSSSNSRRPVFCAISFSPNWRSLKWMAQNSRTP